MPVILATWETEIRKIKVQGQLEQKVYKTPISRNSQAPWCMPIIPSYAGG
jgi:hypothetical protein